MVTEHVRATVYLDSALHRALRRKAAIAGRSMSDIVNEALRTALNEDAADLAAFTERRDEPMLTFDELVTQLRADGKL